MGASARSVGRRPRSISGLVVALIVIAALTLLQAAVRMIGYPSADDGSVAPLSEFLLGQPEQTLLPPAIGLLAGIAAVGVLRGRRWGAILAIAVGTATILGGVILLWVAIVELGVPGSFAVLFVPPGIVALLAGAFILYAALANQAYFRG